MKVWEEWRRSFEPLFQMKSGSRIMERLGLMATHIRQGIEYTRSLCTLTTICIFKRRRFLLLFLSIVLSLGFILTSLARLDRHIGRGVYKCVNKSDVPLVSMPFFRFHNSANFNLTHDYLRPTNTLYPELSVDMVSDKDKRIMEDIIRKGIRLQPYNTSRGEAGWMENGIVYRPWRRPDPITMHKTHPSPYFTEYEAYVPFNESLFFEGRRPDYRYKSKKKTILWYIPTRYTQAKVTPHPLKACPDFPCQITTNVQYSGISSAMIFTAQLMYLNPPARRRADQVFILHNHEPPYQNDLWKNKFHQPQWKSVFNWTMTYRMDSDFIVPYGIVRKRPKPIANKNYTRIVAQKRKGVAWLVSNCHTSGKREHYVKMLQKYIDVDIYGECGTLKCPHENDDQCAELIAQNYKFYLAFESSLCLDYITEKLFHYLTMDTILVVRGTDQYFMHVPSEIYFNTVDFETPKELAMRLNYLDKNDAAYEDMLREKDKYMSLVEGFPVRKADGYIRFMAYRFESVSLCLVCQRLWNLDRHAKSYHDIHSWFDEKLCHRPCDV